MVEGKGCFVGQGGGEERTGAGGTEIPVAGLLCPKAPVLFIPLIGNIDRRVGLFQVLPQNSRKANRLVFQQQDEGVGLLQPGPPFVMLRQHPVVLDVVEGLGFGGGAVKILHHLGQRPKSSLHRFYLLFPTPLEGVEVVQRLYPRPIVHALPLPSRRMFLLLLLRFLPPSPKVDKRHYGHQH